MHALTNECWIFFSHIERNFKDNFFIKIKCVSMKKWMSDFFVIHTIKRKKKKQTTQKPDSKSALCHIKLNSKLSLQNTSKQSTASKKSNLCVCELSQCLHQKGYTG